MRFVSERELIDLMEVNHGPIDAYCWPFGVFSFMVCYHGRSDPVSYDASFVVSLLGCRCGDFVEGGFMAFDDRLEFGRWLCTK